MFEIERKSLRNFSPAALHTLHVVVAVAHARFDPRTVHPVGSRYTDYVTRPVCIYYKYEIIELAKNASFSIF
jgi:hypothetical protein